MTAREHPHDMLRRAEQFITAAFLVTCPSEHGELDRRELEALNTVLGEGMVLLRDANAILQEASAKRADGEADDRRVPRTSGLACRWCARVAATAGGSFAGRPWRRCACGSPAS